MTALRPQLRENLLWTFSIIAGLLLQTILASLLWKICTSFENIKPPVLRLISISAAVIMPETIEERSAAPAETIKPVLPEPAIEQKSVALDPISGPEPVVSEPVKPLPEIVKPKIALAKAKPRPAKKAVKPETRLTPVPAPAAAEVRPAPTVPPPTAGKTMPATAGTESVMASAPNFDHYLQKIYRQLEKNKKYPRNARRRGISGKVAVAFSISSEGKATEAVVTSKSPGELAAAALKLVASQRFERPPEGWNNASRIEMQINYALR